MHCDDAHPIGLEVNLFRAVKKARAKKRRAERVAKVRRAIVNVNGDAVCTNRILPMDLHGIKKYSPNKKNEGFGLN